MGRKHRAWYPGAKYHITSRGNNRAPLFYDNDRIQYLSFLKETMNRYPFTLHSFCLMSNHTHLQLVTSETSPTKIMRILNTKFAKYFNKKYNQTGHVFEKRYGAELLDSLDYEFDVSKYIHLNPLKAGIVDSLEDYPWSSYHAYVNGEAQELIDTKHLLSYFPDPPSTTYEAYVKAPHVDLFLSNTGKVIMVPKEGGKPMCAKVTSIGLKGMEGYRLNVEVRSFVGADSFRIVGLPDAAVKESKERIIAALQSLEYPLSGQKIIINLSPAEQKKSGPMFDFPMAISVLKSLNELDVNIPEDTGFIGALSLDGAIMPVEGMLPAVLAAKKLGIRKLYMPYDKKLPDLELPELEILYVSNLKDVINHLSGKGPLPIIKKNNEFQSKIDRFIDFQQVIGHQMTKRALEIAAAGEHHILMTGPPGCGKSMLAESFPSILPYLTKEAQLEVISLYQLSGNEFPRATMPPYRNPHHSASSIAIIGGGSYPKPGEISLAHRGVLFLDEIAEFEKKTLEMLRQPFENGKITISRTQARITYPSTFILIAAMNPCPCGHTGSDNYYCMCTKRQILSYQNKISGPLRERFDIHLTLKPVNLMDTKGKGWESSRVIRQRVEEARCRQYNRYGDEVCNSRVPYDTLLKTSPLTSEQQRNLQQLAIKENWSNRTQIKIIRLARTISDLQANTSISDQSIWQASKLNQVTGTARGQIN